MHTTKSRNGSSDMPQRTSPATPRTARQIKSGGSDSSPVPSPNISRNLSPKTLERSSPKSPLIEKKRISKVSELECQLAQLKEELKRAKELLSSFEAQKKQAHQEAQEAKKQLSFLSAKLEESQQKLLQLSDSEEARLQERDRVWQSELEALQKQHAMDSSALASAMNEIQRLKKQLEIVAESDATRSRHAESAHGEIQNLRIELSETLQMVDEMKSQLADTKEELPGKDGYKDEEIDSLKLEVGRLKSALEASEIKYQEEYMQSTSLKEEELEKELSKAKDAIEQLKSDLMSKQNALQYVSRENEELSIKILENQTSIKDSELRVELKKLEVDLTHLKSALLEKETRIGTVAEENDAMRSEIGEEAVALAEAAEKEALRRLGCATEEAEKSRRRATKVVEQLRAAQAENAGLEAQLRRLKVQADQWRKAAEAAASMLSPGRDAKRVDRTVSLDSSYHHHTIAVGMKMDHSPFSDSMDCDSPKKKSTTNMLKKIGGLWRKSPK